jgi:hypothetical protein
MLDNVVVLCVLWCAVLQDLCDKAVSSQSHSLHKLLGFQHLAPGALLLRSLTTLFWLRLDSWDMRQVRPGDHLGDTDCSVV